MALLRYYFTIGIIFIILLGSATAAQPKTESPEPILNKPEKSTKRNTTISIEFEGTDSIGSKLSTRIKELMNASNLFTLTEKDSPKIRILLATMSEFSQRPSIGSVYSVIWLFSQSETTLKHFLARKIGVLTADEVDQVAAMIVEQTDTLAVRYGYLLP